jgi:hypothetical protein
MEAGDSYLCNLTSAVVGYFELNHSAAVAFNYFAYDFIGIHRTLRMSPARAAGVRDRLEQQRAERAAKMKYAWRLLTWILTIVFATFFLISLHALYVVARRDYQGHRYVHLLLIGFELACCAFALMWLFRTQRSNSK